jgi:hypothetical protein
MIAWKKGLSGSQLRSAVVGSTVGNGGCNGKGVVNLAAAMGGSTSTPPASTTPGAITGTVTGSGKSKAALGGATVSCGPAGSATTASNGSYTISSVPPGTYTCTASATGYQSKSGSTTVNGGQTSTLSFALRAA